MSDTIIKVEGLGKKYTISHEKREGYTSLRDVISNKVKGLTKSKVKDDFVKKEDFWALKDLTFEVKQGEAIGIIGRNGAGKSTLLKILSRITEPTHGRIELNGRVASLLEVGTGFHPELTGRENVYLNGAILGMSRLEIKRKFDEIIDFSGVEKFLDTPVKRYSSGMYIRLAFAVAAHLEPEILVVDEVLAVGDAEFQKKCLGKMDEVAKTGRTVIFVSHNVNAIKALCSKGILLNNGLLKVHNTIDIVLNEYLKMGALPSIWVDSGLKLKNKIFNPLKFYLIDSEFNELATTNSNDEKIGVIIECELSYTKSDLVIGFYLYNSFGELVYISYQTDTVEPNWPKLKIGKNSLLCWLPTNFLNEGEYLMELICGLHYKEWIISPGGNGPKIGFEIRGGLSESPNYTSARPGVCAPILEYKSI